MKVMRSLAEVLGGGETAGKRKGDENDERDPILTF
jgi:hypothetical protein